MRPGATPIGLQLAHTSKTVSRAFADALEAAGGSVPTWLILTHLIRGDWPAQRRLATALGIEGPTLTRHLDSLERTGLVVRKPAADDRRAVQVELTEAGRTKHAELLGAVRAFDEQLRAGFIQAELDELRALLIRLEANVSSTER